MSLSSSRKRSTSKNGPISELQILKCPLTCEWHSHLCRSLNHKLWLAMKGSADSLACQILDFLVKAFQRLSNGSSIMEPGIQLRLPIGNPVTHQVFWSKKRLGSSKLELLQAGSSNLEMHLFSSKYFEWLARCFDFDLAIWKFHFGFSIRPPVRLPWSS